MGQYKSLKALAKNALNKGIAKSGGEIKMPSKNQWSAVHKIIRKFLGIFLMSLISVSVFAAKVSQVETLLVSDVDDTLKVAHVLNTSETLQNALRVDIPFLGMTSLFQMYALHKENLVFAYVSNAPEFLMYDRHAALLKNAKFPQGELFLRSSLGDNEHKNRTIRALVKKYHPKNLILIGDNAEQDTLIYAKAEAEFPELTVRTYIHQLYSVAASSEAGKNLEKNQIGYVTAVDLALKWYALGEIKPEILKAWISQIVPAINLEAPDQSSGVLAFPVWMNCHDYIPAREEEKLDEPLIAQYIEKRDHRCGIQ
jgi:hypothetical protein